MALWIDNFETDDELVNECLADHVTVGTNVFEDVLVLKERIAELEAENDSWAEKWLAERKENEKLTEAAKEYIEYGGAERAQKLAALIQESE